MKAVFLLLTTGIGISLGCQQPKPDAASGGSRSLTPQSSAEAPKQTISPKTIRTAADLKGRWKFDVDRMVQSKGGEAEDFAAQMNKRNLESVAVHLDFDGKDHFDLLLSGVPTAGHYTLTGRKLKLEITTLMGKTASEWRARRKKTGEITPFDFPDVDAMSGVVDNISGTIRINNLGGMRGGGNPVFFKRAEVETVAPVNSTVSQAEAAYVGKWKGKFEPKGKSPYPPAMLENITLDLRKDHTFTFVMMQEANGAWHLEKGELVLGDPPTRGVDVRPKFKPSADGKTLVRVDPKSGEKMTFTRDGK